MTDNDAIVDLISEESENQLGKYVLRCYFVVLRNLIRYEKV